MPDTPAPKPPYALPLRAEGNCVGDADGRLVAMCCSRSFTDEEDRLNAAALARAANDAAGLRALLRRVEWVDECCHVCKNCQPEGHRPGCELVAALAGGEERP